MTLACVWCTDDPEQLKRLRLQLAITIDVGKLLIKKTYLLEGDGEQIVEAYSHLQEISTAVALVLKARTNPKSTGHTQKCMQQK